MNPGLFRIYLGRLAILKKLKLAVLVNLMVIPVCCQEEGSRKVIAAAVARLLGTNQIDPHAASLSGQRQLAAATRARDAVAGALDAVEGGFGLDAVSVCVDDALDALCELTGENASEAVINEVFERFCVGK